MKLESFSRVATARALQFFSLALVIGACSSAAESTPATTPGPSGLPTAAPAPAMGSSTPATTPVATPSPVMTPATMNTPAAPVGGNTAQPPAPPVVMMPPGSMTPDVPPAMAAEPPEMGTPTLFWLEIGRGLVTRANADGSSAMQFASGAPLSSPDGITVDPVDKHVFVLNMGMIAGGANTGSLVRYNLDGSGAEVIMKPGTKVGNDTFNTGKQVAMDRVNRKLYLGDREGSKVWRCDMDGSNLEVLVSGHGIRQIVGVAPDPTKNEFYFSDRNGKKLYRAPMQMPDGKTHADREDLTLLYVDTAPNAMPLDLELDLKTRTLFWTDKEQGKVFAMPMDIPAGEDAMTRKDVKTLASNLTQVIGLGLDRQESRLYVTHSGSVSSLKTDGSDLKRIGMNGSTGMAFVRLP